MKSTAENTALSGIEGVDADEYDMKAVIGSMCKKAKQRRNICFRWKFFTCDVRIELMKRINEEKKEEELSSWYILHFLCILSLTHAAQKQDKSKSSQTLMSHVTHCILLEARLAIAFKHGDICTNHHIYMSQRGMHSIVQAVHLLEAALEHHCHCHCCHLKSECCHHDHHGHDHDHVHGCGLLLCVHDGNQDSVEGQ